ncbi:hypothetical protein [Nocardioides mangrovi]|uniref:Uncharacterized protein n=1 Tax=Nocardioides mangrovi TaxID=2874580 RepID=A0ABS7UIF5_9ACTN|nr:hypothetical protein [Nocardioides mangrovi]MBZ5740013.1 hypothetical protein [Nocardioides mangrovi]MBZ5740816.1 hypothetical protein [Nocardioides mangrovi]
MTPAGQNYPIHEHTFLFWGVYLGIVITVTFLALGLFVWMVHRTSQATRPVDATPERDALPAAAPDHPAGLHAA